MTQLSAHLKLEVSKYKDIDHILKKLEDDGEIQPIFDLFKTLFDGEFKFTLQELLRIQEAKKESINIKKQCENNLTLFKNNLVLIVNMIIEKALKSTLSENKAKLEEGRESAADEATEQTAFVSSVSTVSQLKKVTDREARSKDQKRVPKDQALNLSVEAKLSNEKKGNFSQLSTSKVDSPLKQLLGTSTPLRSKDNPTPSKEKSSLHMSQRITPMSAHASRSSLFQPTDVNNSASFVQSEFNHIRGSVKFSRSPKSRERQDLSPGPGTYPSKSTLRMSPTPKIGTSAKVCWFDKMAKNDSPGPHLYPSKHFLSK